MVLRSEHYPQFHKQYYVDDGTHLQVTTLWAMMLIHIAMTRCFLKNWICSTVNGSIKNYYNVLDVDPKADDKEIKSAFYAQSKKLHPDVTPDDDKAPDKFNELVEAYEVLSDSKKREAYDDILSKKNRRATFHSQPQGKHVL